MEQFKTSDDRPIFARFNLKCPKTYKRVYDNISCSEKLYSHIFNINWGGLVYTVSDVNIAYNSFLTANAEIFRKFPPFTECDSKQSIKAYGSLKA